MLYDGSTVCADTGEPDLMKAKRQFFGTLSDGGKASLFTVQNAGLTLSATDFGCAITSLVFTADNGKKTDVVLGFPTLDGYAQNWGSFGAVIGRYSNKISGPGFLLDGKHFPLFDNCGGTCLHGGFPRWENILWRGKCIRRHKVCGIAFENMFPDGFQGFPGNLRVRVEYLIDDSNTLTARYCAVTDSNTPVSITNHSYFNLSGSGDVRNHELQLFCRRVLETGRYTVPTGKILDVKDSPYDFLQQKKIGAGLALLPEGYDVCFVTDAFSEKSGIPSAETPLVRTAELSDVSSGIKMSVSTNAEGMQLYTAQHVKYLPGKYGAYYMPFSGICFETQNFPDSPNRPEFPSVILRPGQLYTSITEYHFSQI